MKKTYDIKIITETNQSDFEEKLQSIIYEYESRDYEVEVQYSFSRDVNLDTIYSALVMVYANYNESGYRIDR